MVIYLGTEIKGEFRIESYRSENGKGLSQVISPAAVPLELCKARVVANYNRCYYRQLGYDVQITGDEEIEKYRKELEAYRKKINTKEFAIWAGKNLLPNQGEEKKQ